MLPMYQSEAMWINFDSEYPFAVKIGAGKINAVTGKSLHDGLSIKPQDYLVVPDQPWLDGYCVEEGIIRQFVAMPLGSGYSAEEQITGEAAHGGLQIVVYPMKAKAYRRRFSQRVASPPDLMCTGVALAMPDMGLAAGGRMHQEIFEDGYGLGDWDLEHKSRCFVHIANSMVWRAITGQAPPTVPPTAKEYAKAGIPWFEYYDDSQKALKGSNLLGKLKSVAKLGKEKGDVPLPDNEAATIDAVIKLRKGLVKGQVREGVF